MLKTLIIKYSNRIESLEQKAEITRLSIEALASSELANEMKTIHYGYSSAIAQLREVVKDLQNLQEVKK